MIVVRASEGCEDRMNEDERARGQGQFRNERGRALSKQASKGELGTGKRCEARMSEGKLRMSESCEAHKARTSDGKPQASKEEN